MPTGRDPLSLSMTSMLRMSRSRSVSGSSVAFHSWIQPCSAISCPAATHAPILARMEKRGHCRYEE